MPVIDRETKALRAFQALREDPNALERLAAKGVRNFLLAGGDGLVIDAVTASKTLDVDEIAASAASSLNVARAKAAGLRLGAVKGIVVEFESGEAVVLDPVADDAMAVYLSDSPSGMEQLGRELPHLARVLDPGREYLTPEVEAPAAPVAQRAVQPSAAPQPAPAPEGASPELARRLILRKAELETAGFTASATVELSFGSRHAVGKAVGRNIPDQYLALAAEATIRAVIEFMPTGYGIVLENIQPVSSATEVAVWANVIFITPTEEQLLPGIARLDGQPALAAAKTILSAVNRRLEMVLADIDR
ncbi:MAG TPA: roadblock/LC7 domain-containing protein [bacterium]|nr:roadblock/LC7 domain-containing protein [bacterium]